MSRNIFEPTLPRTVYRNQRGLKFTSQRPHAFRWWTPGCSTADADDADAGCTGDEPALVNGWAQPAAPLQLFAFRLHADGSLEFKGHLDSAGASSGTVAVTLPGANAGEVDFLSVLDGDQFFLTVIYDGANPQAALVYIEKSSGDVTITFPLV